MVATNNIKVYGRWYAAGEEIPEEKPEKKTEIAEKKDPVVSGQISIVEIETVPEAETAPETVAAETVEQPKKTATRRKKNRE